MELHDYLNFVELNKYPNIDWLKVLKVKSPNIIVTDDNSKVKFRQKNKLGYYRTLPHELIDYGTNDNVHYNIYNSTECDYNFWIYVEIVDKLKIIGYISVKTKKYFLCCIGVYSYLISNKHIFIYPSHYIDLNMSYNVILTNELKYNFNVFVINKYFNFHNLGTENGFKIKTDNIVEKQFVEKFSNCKFNKHKKHEVTINNVTLTSHSYRCKLKYVFIIKKNGIPWYSGLIDDELEQYCYYRGDHTEYDVDEYTRVIKTIMKKAKN